VATRRLLALLALVAACHSTPKVTAVRIQVSFPSAYEQVRFGLAIDGQDLFTPVLRPDRAGAALQGVQDHVVYLDDDRAGQPARCSAEPYHQGHSLARGTGQVTVVRQSVAICVVSFGGDGGRPDAGPDGRGPDAGGGDLAPVEAGADSDAPRIAVDAPVADAAGPADASVVPDAPDAPDAPVVVPLDAAVDAAELPPDGPVIATGCGDGTREAFANEGAFPRVAGCGAAGGTTVSYEAALTANLCAAGWHWCRPAEVGALPVSPAPGGAAGSCGWVDNRGSSCNNKLGSFTQLGCQGSSAITASIAGPNSGATCLLLDLLCEAPWKLSVPLDSASWAASSAGVAGATCFDHQSLRCASGGDPGCFVTCCAN
jgi:hypothetical protein